jgi:hypothetical protein
MSRRTRSTSACAAPAVAVPMGGAEDEQQGVALAESGV